MVLFTRRAGKHDAPSSRCEDIYNLRFWISNLVLHQFHRDNNLDKGYLILLLSHCIRERAAGEKCGDIHCVPGYGLETNGP